MKALTDVLTSLRGEIHRRHRHQLRCINVRVDTDDLYQAVCARAWKARDKCRGSSPAELRNWVLTIAANEARNMLDHHLDRDCRSLKRTGRIRLKDWDAIYRVDQLARMIEAETHVEQANRVKAALREVTPKRREVVTLRYKQGWPYDRIAGRMGVGIEHSRSMACQGLKDLRHLVGA